LAGPPDRVVEHLLLEVEDLDRSLVAHPPRQVEGVVAGPRPDLEHPLARGRLEDLTQAITGDPRMRGLDPEPLAVGTRRRVLAPPQRDTEDGDGPRRGDAPLAHDLRKPEGGGSEAEHALGHLFEKPIVCAAAAVRTNPTFSAFKVTGPSSASRSCQPCPRCTASRSVCSASLVTRADITCPPAKPTSIRFISAISPPIRDRERALRAR